MGNPRGHAADGLQPVGMAELFHGGDAGGGLLANLPLRLRQLLAHQVQAFAEVCQLVVCAEVDRPLQVSRGNEAGFLHQRPQRPSHQTDAQSGGQQPAQQRHAADQKRRPPDDLPLIVLQLGHRMSELQAAAALGAEGHGPVDVQLRPAVRVEGLDRQVLLDRHGRQPFGGDRGEKGIARPGVKPHPANAKFMLLPLIYLADDPEHAFLSAAAPGVGHHVLHGAAERFGLDARRVLEEADLAADRPVAVDRRQQDVPERESQNELQRESHVFLSQDGIGTSLDRGAFFPTGASWGALGGAARPGESAAGRGLSPSVDTEIGTAPPPICIVPLSLRRA